MPRSSLSPELPTLDLLDRGKFSDFTIQCGTHTWKVHKAILYQESAYFAKLLGGDFKEAKEDVLFLNDDPKYLAVLLTSIYGASYVFSPGEDDLPPAFRRSLPILLTPVQLEELVEEFRTSPLTSHATIFDYAGKFAVRSLKFASQRAFLRELASDFDMHDLITSIPVVYEATEDPDHKLRAWAVIVAQGYKAILRFRDDFNELLLTWPDFARDFATKYMQEQHLFCSQCGVFEMRRMKAPCICGFNGICMRGTACGTRLSQLYCRGCRKVGTIKRVGPSDDFSRYQIQPRGSLFHRWLQSVSNEL